MPTNEDNVEFGGDVFNVQTTSAFGGLTQESLQRLREMFASESSPYLAPPVPPEEVVDGVVTSSIPGRTPSGRRIRWNPATRSIELREAEPETEAVNPFPSPEEVAPPPRRRWVRRQSTPAPTPSTAEVPRCRSCSRQTAVCPRCKWGGCCGCVCKKCATCDPMLVKRYAPGHFCGFCGKCETVCVCRKRKGYFNLSTITSTHHINTLKRHLGLELEIGDWQSLTQLTPTFSFRFKATVDSSVRPSGKEMVVQPLVGDAFLTGVVELGKLLHNHGCEMNESCGFHVHVNAQDLNWWSLRRLVKLWVKVEHGVYNHLVAPERTDNRYCHRMKNRLLQLDEALMDARSASDIKSQLFTVAYGRSFSQLPRNKFERHPSQQANWVRAKSQKYGADNRYWGLNLHTYFFRGTVEFRMFEGTTDLGALVNWPLLCGWMVDAAANLNDKQIDQVENLLDFAQRYCPAPVSEWVSEKYKTNNNNVSECPDTDTQHNDEED